jgi:autotransporter-associated beta strand protein
LGSASSILGGAGTINLSNAGTITGSGYGLTLGGAQGGTLASILGTGAGTLTKQDAGTWTLSGANTYSGTTTISAGKLKVGVANAIPSTSAVTVTGTLDLNGFSDAVGSLAGGGTVDNGSGAGTYTLTTGADNTNTTFSGAIQNTSGSVALTKSGTGTLTLSGTNTFSGATTVNAGNHAGTWTLTGANTYTGTTTISAGKLKVGVANAIPSTSAVTVTGTLDLNGFSDAVGSLAGGGTVDNGSGVGTYTLSAGVDNTSTTFSGAIQNTSGSVALTKSGTGTLTLSGTNTFSGATTVNAGFLLVNGTDASSAVTVNTGGSLGGTGTTGAVSVVSGEVQPGSASKGILTASSADFSGGSSSELDLRASAFTTAGDGLRPVQDHRGFDIGRNFGPEPGPHGLVGNRHHHRDCSSGEHHGNIHDGEFPELLGLQFRVVGVQRGFDRRGHCQRGYLHVDRGHQFGLGDLHQLVAGRHSEHERQHRRGQSRWSDHRLERKPEHHEHHTGQRSPPMR